jgi:cytochrome c oxidase cbb3-type subunit I/II
MLVGVIIALQLAYWPANLGLPWTTFGRLRPLHTNAVIFAFGGNILFTGIYYSTQRLLKVRMWNDMLSRLHFWGWQLIIVLAAVTLVLGMTQSKEYAELIWPIDLLITVVWVIFAVNLFGTIAVRQVKHMYVAIWFYISFVITIAVLHIVNSLAIPATLFRSYPVYSGLTDALVQWWYGHNAVGFFLTTPFLGLMYYFLPKAAERPVYSYRLSIIHFWALVFLYIWAGPHHLLLSALPDWAQTLGMVFSVMLIAPSWGGMLNGLLTLKGSWERMRTDAVLKFMVVAVSFYGMSTFEGPMMSIRAVNSLAHFTNWVIGHVHSGALGWVGMISFGVMYWLIPRLYNRPLWNEKWPTYHFWLATIGIVLYTVTMWVAGLMEGLQWRAIDQETGLLQYPIFIDIVRRLMPYYWLRVVGGGMYLVGMIMLAINYWNTIRSPEPVAAAEPTPAPAD